MAELLVEKATGNVIEVREDGSKWTALEKDGPVLKKVFMPGPVSKYQYLATDTMDSMDNYIPPSMKASREMYLSYLKSVNQPVKVEHRYYLDSNNEIRRRSNAN